MQEVMISSEVRHEKTQEGVDLLVSGIAGLILGI
jgi:hypothetical protein